MAASLQLNQIRRQTISTRLLDSGAVIYDPDRRLELYLNETGFAIWQRLDGRHNPSQIVDHLQTIFEDPETSYQDFDSYLELLNQNQLIEVSDKTLPPETFSSHTDSPTSFDVSITGHCNLNCPFCYYSEAIKTRHDLPFSEWQQFFTELKSLGARDVCLSGGEIMCRPDLFDFVDCAIDARMCFSLISNGTLGNEKFIEQLFKKHRNKRLTSLQLSVDGSGPHTHDIIRGEGSFARTDRFLRQLKEAGVTPTVRVTISRVNLNDLPATFAYLLKDIGLPSVSTNSACSLGSAVDNADQLSLSPAERLQAMQTLRHLADEVWPDRIKATAGPLYESRQFESMQQHKQHHPSYNGHLSACGCFRNKLAIHHDGIITPCNMLGNVELGRINRDSIREIWLHSPILKKMASRTAFSLKNIEACRECEFVDICNGGCPAEEISNTGDFFRPSLSNCCRHFLTTLKTPD